MTPNQTTPRCARCTSRFVRRTRPREPYEYLLRLFARAPFQCQVCGYRFQETATSLPEVGAAPDQRHFDRLRTQIPVTFAVDNGTETRGVVTNLTLAGCQLHTQASVAPRSILHMTLAPVDMDEAIVIERAVVRSVDPPAIGVQFVQFAAGGRDRLSRLIRVLLREQHAVA